MCWTVLYSCLHQINNKNLTPNLKSGCNTFPQNKIETFILINGILKVYLRDPSNYTPIRPEWVQPGKPSSLILGMCEKMNKENISKFSKKDAIAYQEYERELEQFVKAIDPLLDAAAVDVR